MIQDTWWNKRFASLQKVLSKPNEDQEWADLYSMLDRDFSLYNHFYVWTVKNLAGEIIEVWRLPPTGMYITVDEDEKGITSTRFTLSTNECVSQPDFKSTFPNKMIDIDESEIIRCVKHLEVDNPIIVNESEEKQ